MPQPAIRPVRADEWRLVRDLRLRAVRDPAAGVAFVDSESWTRAQPDSFWQDRAAGAAVDAGEDGRLRQFVAVAGDGRWIGSVTGILERTGDTDVEGRSVTGDSCLVVGVYLDPAHRGAGLLGRLVDAVEEWAAAHGIRALRLSVHRANPRARRAYEKLGFRPTGVGFTGAIGPEAELRREP